MQYTIRNLPPPLDEAIRRRAKEEGKSLNTVALEALMQAFGLRGSAQSYRDVAELAGSWVEDAAVDEALGAQRGIDDEMWR